MKKLLFVISLTGGLLGTVSYAKMINTDKLITKFVQKNSMVCKAVAGMAAAYVIGKCAQAYLQERRHRQYRKIADQHFNTFLNLVKDM